MPVRGTSKRRTGKTLRKDLLYKKIFSPTTEEDVITSESRFLTACQHGNEQEVMSCVLQDGVNVNCVDFLGRNAIELAADGDHEEVIEFLLPRINAQCVQDALLHSVSLGRVNICEILLKHTVFKSNKFNLAGGEFYNKRMSDNPRFSSDITPIMLAAQLNNYRMVQMLLLHGSRITKPHDYNCHCVECRNMRIYDSVKYSRTRLNAYRGLAGTAYLSLAHEDPLMAAFRLSHELDYLETVEKEYQTEYRQLNEKCKNYAVQLLNQCRTSEEVTTTLTGSQKKRSTSNTNLQNLLLALKYDQKRFIAHAVVQRQLSLLWYGHALFLRNRSGWFHLAMVPLAVLAFPLLVLAFIVAPAPKVVRLMESPIVKFVNHSISYFLFLVWIFIASVRYGQIWVQIACQQVNHSAAATVTHDTFWYLIVQVLIFCWAAGMLGYEVKQVFFSGIRRYLKDWWNFIDMFTISSYMCSLALSVFTYLKITTGNEVMSAQMCKDYYEAFSTSQYCDPHFSCSIQTFEQNKYGCSPSPSMGSTEFFQQKWLSEETIGMPDPQQLADIIFAIANTMSFIRIAYLLPASNQLGPLLISYGRMMNDGKKFFVVFLIVFLTFLCGLSSLYKVHPCNNSYFTRIDLTVRSLFWATFGMGDSNAPVIDARSRNYNITHSSYSKDAGFMLTEVFGYVMFGLYIMAAVIVLLNMLIAMMSNTFQEIYDDSDVEWKFARTELWMTYVNEENTLPAPFNLVPRPYAIFTFFRDLYRRRNHMNDDDDGGFIIQNNTRGRGTVAFEDAEVIESSMRNSGMTRVKSEKLDPYRRTIKRLVKRYVFQKLYKIDKRQKKMDNESGRFDHEEEELINTLSHDLSALREEVASLTESLDLLLTKRSGRGRLPGSFRKQLSEHFINANQTGVRRDSGGENTSRPTSPDSLHSDLSSPKNKSSNQTLTFPSVEKRRNSEISNVSILAPLFENDYSKEVWPSDGRKPPNGYRKRNGRRASILDDLQHMQMQTTNITMATLSNHVQQDQNDHNQLSRENSDNMVSQL